MQFTSAKPTDKAAVMELWAKDFESYEPYFSWYFNTVYKDERTFLLKEGEELLAAAQLAPYMLKMRGECLPIDFAVGVITQPEHRGKGLGAKLMRELLRVQKERGKYFSLLVAVTPIFYAKLGYCHCYEDKRCDMPIGELEAKGQFAGCWQSCEIEAAIPLLQGIYKKMTAALNGCIIRTAENWRNFLTELLNDKGQILLYSEKGEPKSYMLLLPNSPVGEEKLFLREMGICEPQYQNACLQYIKANFPKEKELYWLAPQSAEGIAVKSLKAGAMAYCLAAEKVLAALPYCQDGQLSLQITEQGQQSKSLLLDIKNGRTSVQPFEGEADILLDNAALTQLCFGFHTAEELAESGSIRGKEATIKLLNESLPKQQTWLSEQT